MCIYMYPCTTSKFGLWCDLCDVRFSFSTMWFVMRFVTCAFETVCDVWRHLWMVTLKICVVICEERFSKKCVVVSWKSRNHLWFLYTQLASQQNSWFPKIKPCDFGQSLICATTFFQTSSKRTCGILSNKFLTRYLVVVRQESNMTISCSLVSSRDVFVGEDIVVIRNLQLEKCPQRVREVKFALKTATASES